MTDNDKTGIAGVDQERSILVVSDLHLGSHKGERTSSDFQSFLTWLTTACNASNATTVEMKSGKIPRTKILRPPQMLILLGDIADFWVQREPLRKALLDDTYPLIPRLLKLPIPIIYVIGNHDREIYEIKGKFLDSGTGKMITIEPDQYPHPSKDRAHPISDKGLKVGNKYEYTFLHGHQLDKSFQIVRAFSEFPGWVSNNSSIFELHPLARKISWSVTLFGIFFGILLILNYLSFVPPVVNTILIVLVGASIPVSIIAIPSDWLDLLYRGVGDTAIGKKLKPFFTRRIHAERWKRIDYFKAIREFRKKRDSGGTNVVIFGHTHMLDDYNDLKINKRFINTGTWDSSIQDAINFETGLRYHIVGKDKDSINESDYFSRVSVWNTFVYIDKEGPFTMMWDTEDKNNPSVRFVEIKQIAQRDV